VPHAVDLRINEFRPAVNTDYETALGYFFYLWFGLELSVADRLRIALNTLDLG